MRQKRAKAYKKLMSLYQLSFGFREPYQILVGSDMCSSSMALKLDLVKLLANVLQGGIKPMITQCSIVELYKRGSAEQQAVDLAKSFERRKCNHREAIPGDECIASVVGNTNKHRYVIACQSQPLRAQLRSIPGTPIVHLNRSVVVLEPPSYVTLHTKQQAEEKALLPSAPDPSQVTTHVAEEAPQRKRKGPKAPNPLSVKKKKVNTNEDRATAGTKRKRDEGHLTHNDGIEGVGKPKRKRRKKAALTHPKDPE